MQTPVIRNISRMPSWIRQNLGRESGYGGTRHAVHGNRLRTLSDSYKRYLENQIRERYGFLGTPIRLLHRSLSRACARRTSTPSSTTMLSRLRMKS